MSGTKVAHVVDSAREDEIENRAATALQPRLKAHACFCHDFKLNRSAGLLLRNRRTIADVTTANDIANSELDEITTTQLAVDRQIEQHSITQPLVFVEVETNSPNVARLERTLRPYILACVPRAPFVNSGVEV